MRTLFIIIGIVFALTFKSCATPISVESPTVKVIKAAPKHHKIVVVKGKQFYFWNGRYYKKTRKGYIVVKV